MDWAWWQWVLAVATAVVGWPAVVYFTAVFWGAGSVAGEIRYVSTLKQRKGDDGTGT